MEKRNVYCMICHKLVGIRMRNGAYKVNEGVIQTGRGRNADLKSLMSYCSDKCYRKESVKDIYYDNEEALKNKIEGEEKI